MKYFSVPNLPAGLEPVPDGFACVEAEVRRGGRHEAGLPQGFRHHHLLHPYFEPSHSRLKGSVSRFLLTT